MLKRIAAAALMTGALLATGGLLSAQIRFDSVEVRDLFTGLGGDPDAFKRAMEAFDKMLAQNPDNAGALVWHGAGTLFQSRLEGETNMQRRLGLFQKGTSEMDRAVSLEPDSIAVRIPRGGTLRMLTPGMPNFPILTTLIENARSDYQHAFDMQKDQLDSLGTHPLGELLQGLGDLYSRQGKTEEAQKYYIMIQAKLRGTVYAERAEEWMKTRRPLPPEQTACVGCHTGK